MGTKTHAMTAAGTITGAELVPLSVPQATSPLTYLQRQKALTSILNDLGIYRGSGSPESAVTAPVGSIYLRTNGGANTTLYVKESGSGNTGWVAK